MQDTIIMRETFSSRDDAEEARERLEYAGFARNSMNIMRMGDEYELSIRTRPQNRQRVQDCIDGSGMMFEARRYGREISEYAPSAGQSILLVGALAAVGTALYYAFSRRRDAYALRYPSEQRSAVRSLYQAHREEHQQGTTHGPDGGGQRFAGRSPGLSSGAAGYGA